MKRPASKIVLAATVSGMVLIVLAGVRAAVRPAPSEDLPCGTGFARVGTRCCPSATPLVGRDECSSGVTCPAPLVMTPRGCDTPARSVVEIPGASVLIGPSDWEAEGRVRPRTVKTRAFAIDRFEVSVGHMGQSGDPARAASAVTLAEARTYCAAHGGRLPTEDEWIVAAAGERPRRYPWGDTGAVCRRAAWGLTRGPCGNGAAGPDTAGAHPDGVTPLGVHDLAGNVEEWVETGACPAVDPRCLGVVRGGSFETDLATELRTWVRREVLASARLASIGFRCAYEPVGSSAP
jgi:formylglycine-generating enzyme required for sulfatase activity